MDFTRLNKVNERHLKRFLGSKQSSRRLVIHPSLRVFMTRLAADVGLTNFFSTIHFFDDDFMFTAEATYCFLIPSDITVLKRIFDLRVKKQGKYVIELWFQPKRTGAVTAFMIETGTAPESILSSYPTPEKNLLAKGLVPKQDISVNDLGVELFPYDVDLIDLGCRHSFMSAASLGDLSITSSVRSALDTFAAHFNGFYRISAVGELSTSIAKTLQPPVEGNGYHLILIDRKADYVTPNITQMSYEGLISEYLGIDFGVVNTMSENSKGNLQVLSSTNDHLYPILATMSLTEASDLIHTRTNLLNETFTHKSFDSFEESTSAFRKTAQISLENKTLLDHLSLAEALNNKMRKSKWFNLILNEEPNIILGYTKGKEIAMDMMEVGCDLREAIRVLSLDYLFRGSVSDFNKVVSMLHFNYGIQQLPYLHRLQDAQLLSPNPCPVKWSNILKKMNAYEQDFVEKNDTAAYLYQGYAPISVRVSQKITNNEFKYVSKVYSDEGIPTSDVGAHIPPEDANVVVCYVGGCTYTEIATLRRLSQETGPKFQVVTTEIYSSKEFYSSFGKDIPGWSPLI